MIDVFVICYNQAEYIRQAVASVRWQTVPYNLYIVDDASADGSQAIIEKQPGAHILHKHNIGICATLNQLLCESTGEYFAILAADDYWLPDHLETLLGNIGEHGVCYSDGLMITADGTPIRRFTEAHNVRGYVPQGNIYEELLRGNWINACATLVRRSVMDGVWYDERMIYEDYDMWLRLAKGATFKYVDKVTTHIRRLPSSLLHTELMKNTDKTRYSNELMWAKHAR